LNPDLADKNQCGSDSQHFSSFGSLIPVLAFLDPYPNRVAEGNEESNDLGVRDEDKNGGIVLELLLQPDAGLQVQMVRRLVKQQQVRPDEQCPAS